jgi:regulator of sigma E protease
METILIKAAQLILSLSILVVLHEFGHFIFARLFKTRVEKFYLFFDPWFSLFKVKKGETEYGVGWLPLGGYVKISGMIDESMDKEAMKQPPKPWEFRSKPAWQRLLIMLGGVMMNFIFAMIIYIGVLYVWGETYLPTENVPFGIEVNEVGKEIGFQNGDKIISVDGKQVENFMKIIPTIVLDGARTVQVERDGRIIDVEISDADLALLLKSKDVMTWRKPFDIQVGSSTTSFPTISIPKKMKPLHLHFYATEMKSLKKLTYRRKENWVSIRFLTILKFFNWQPSTTDFSNQFLQESAAEFKPPKTT